MKLVIFVYFNQPIWVQKLLVLEIATMAKIDVSLVFTIKALMGNSSAPNPIFTLLGGSEEALEIIN